MDIINYTDESLDSFVDELNRCFDSSRLENVKAVDVYDVVDYIGCTPDWKYLTPDQSILGMTVFKPTLYYVWDKPFYVQGDIPKKIFFEKRTIVIDRTLNEGNKQKNLMENFTVIHECFHWLLHRRIFESDNADDFQCCSEKSVFSKMFLQNETVRILEHQANRCAASFLMPRKAVINEFMDIAKMKNCPQTPLPERNMKKYIAETAKRFGVNFNPIKYRLQELGFIQK